MKKRILAALLAVAVTGLAQAHGAKPKHGGTVQTVNDIAYELVAKDGKAVIYIDDHGKEVATQGATGKLTILTGTQKAEFELQPSGTNTLSSAGEVKLEPKSKAVASITLAGKEPVNVRFAKK